MSGCRGRDDEREEGGGGFDEAYRPVLDGPLRLDHARLVWEDADVAGAVDHAVVLYGLGELGEGGRGGGREDFFLGHFCGLFVLWSVDVE